MSTWIEALKEWNTKRGGVWCVPKKGSPEYEQVREIMTKQTPVAQKAIQTLKKGKVAEFLKKAVAKKRKTKAEKAEQERLEKEPDLPLVSKSQWEKNFELLKLAFKRQLQYIERRRLGDESYKPPSPIKKADKAKYEDIYTAFGHFIEKQYEDDEKLRDFLWLLMKAYKEGTGPLHTNKLFSNEESIHYSLAKYFNIYPSEKMKIVAWGKNKSGYFAGFDKEKEQKKTTKKEISAEVLTNDIDSFIGEKLLEYVMKETEMDEDEAKDYIDENYGEVIEDYGHDELYDDVMKEFKKYKSKLLAKALSGLEGWTIFDDFIEEHLF